MSRLEQTLSLSYSDELNEKLNEVKNKLEHIYDYKLNGIFIRSRARWIEEGEKNTRYFLSMEKRNRATNNISSLVINGNTISDRHLILDQAKLFYE